METVSVYEHTDTTKLPCNNNNNNNDNKSGEEVEITTTTIAGKTGKPREPAKLIVNICTANKQICVQCWFFAVFSLFIY